MARMVKCAKLGKELPAIPYKPFNNELGQRIYDSISMEAWKGWLEFSKMIVNEYRLDLTSPQGQKLMAKVLEGHAQRIQSLFAGLQPHEQETMLGLLKRMEAHLHKVISPQAGNGT